MKLTIKSQGQDKVVDLSKDLQFNVSKGEQYIFSNGFTSYVLSFKDNQKSVELTFKVDGKTIKVELKGIVPFLQENIEGMQNPTLVIINKSLNEKEVDNIVSNDNFNGSEIIDRLEALLSQPVDLGSAGPNDKMAIISDFQSLVETLDAAAAGGEQGGNSNGSTFNSIFSSINDSLNGIADTDRWVNLTESISSIPVDTGNTIAQVEVEKILIVTPVDSKDPTVPIIPGNNQSTVNITTGDVRIPEGTDAIFKIDTTNPGLNDTTIKVSIGNGISKDPASVKEDLDLGKVEFYDQNGKKIPNEQIIVDGNGNYEVPLKTGDSVVYIKIPTFDDNIIEGDEDFKVNIIVDGKTATGTGIIVDNDETTVTVVPTDPSTPGVPTIPGVNTTGNSVVNNNVRVPEGNDAIFKTDIKNPSSKDETVTVKLNNGTADINNDLVLNNVKFYGKDGSELVTVNKGNGEFEVKLPAGQTEFYTKVPTFNDLIVEGEENFTITSTLVDGKTATGTGIIVDNDETTVTVVPTDPSTPGVPTIPGVNTTGNSVVNNNVRVPEGNDAIFKTDIKNPSSKDETVTVKLNNGTADINNDLVLNNVKFYGKDGSELVTVNKGNGEFEVKLPAGQTEFYTKVPTFNDLIVEGEENFTITSTLVDGKTATGTGIIVDNDETTVTVVPTDPSTPGVPTIPGVNTTGNSVVNNNVRVPEGNDAIFKTDIKNPSSKDETVTVKLNNGTADINNDLVLNNVKFYGKDGSELVTVNKGNGEFEVKLPAGQTEFYTKVPTFNDLIVEGEENFTITSTLVDGKTATGTGIIVDNDETTVTVVPTDPSTPGVPTIPGVNTTGNSVVNNNVRVPEGNDAIFKTDIKNPSSKDETVTVKLNNGTADINNDLVLNNVKFYGKDGSELVTVNKGNGEFEVKLPAGQTEFYTKVPTFNDLIVEGEENFTITSTLVDGKTATGTGIIVDNDETTVTVVPTDPSTPGVPTIPGVNTTGNSVVNNNVRVPEGNDAIFKTDIKNPSSKDETVTVKLNNGTADINNDLVLNNVKFYGKDGSELVTVNKGNGEFEVKLPAGQTEFYTKVPTFNDLIVEGEENFTITSTLVDGKTATGTGIIVDNDETTVTVVPTDPSTPGVPTIPGVNTTGNSVVNNNVRVPEGNDAIFKTDIKNPSSKDETVTVKLNNGTADINNDLVLNNVKFYGKDGSELVTVNKGNGEFEVKLPAGQTEFYTKVPTFNDLIVEGEENFTITSTLVDGKTATGTGIIVDNDETTVTVVPTDPSTPGVPTIPGVNTTGNSVVNNNVRVPEGNDAIFKTDIKNPSSKDETVTVKLNNGTADINNDLVLNNVKFYGKDGSELVTVNKGNGEFEVKLPAGQTEFYTKVPTFNDLIVEGEENFTITSTLVDGKTATGTGIIVDNDETTVTVVPTDPSTPGVPTIPGVNTTGNSVVNNNVRVPEGNDAIFKTDIKNPSSKDETVTVKLNNGTADINNDLVLNNVKFYGKDGSELVTVNKGNGEFEVKLPAGQTEFYTKVPTFNDLIVEGEENFTITSTLVDGKTATGTGIIVDNDETTVTVVPTDPSTPGVPTIPGVNTTGNSVVNNNVRVPEGNDAIFKTDIKNPSSKDETVTVKLNNGTADINNDLVLNNVKFYGKDGSELVTVNKGNGEFEVKLPAGQTEFYTKVPTFNDLIVEGEENFTITSTLVDGKTATGTGIIVDNDETTVTVVPTDPSTPGVPTIPGVNTTGNSVVNNNVRVPEGNDAIFKTDIKNPSSKDETVTVKLNNGTADINNDLVLNNVKFYGKDGSELVTVNKGNGEFEVKLPAGQTEFYTKVPTFNDLIVEGEENFTITSTLVDGKTATGTGIIVDNDETTVTVVPTDPSTPGVPTIPGVNTTGNSVVNNNVRVPEGNDAIFKTDIKNPSSKDETVTVKLNNGTADINNDLVLNNVKFYGKDGSELVTVNKGNGEFEVKLPAGQTEFYTKVPTFNDLIVEGEENFTITSTLVDGKTATGTGIIVDNDETTVTVVPTDPSTPGVPTIPGVNTTGNSVVNNNVRVPEGNDAIFKTDIKNPSSKDETVTVKLNNGTADINNDLVLNNVKFYGKDGSELVTVNKGNGEFEVKLPAGQTEFYTKVPTFNDLIVEGEENFTITSTLVDGKTATGTGIIVDNDETTVTVVPTDPSTPGVPTIPGVNTTGNSVVNNNVRVPEGNDAIFKTDIKNPSSKDETVTVKLNNGTADINNDLVLNNVKFYGKDGSELVTVNKGNGEFEVKLPAGQTEFYTKVPTFNDLIVEGEENFTITSTLVDGKTATGTGIIVDNDETTVTVVPTDPSTPGVPTIPGVNTTGNSVVNNNVRVPEGNDAIFKTDIKNPSSKDETVTVKLNNGTADINNDLVLNNVKFYGKDGSELVTVNKGNGEFEVKLPAGQTEFYTKVPTFNDLIVEGEENFTITSTLVDGKTATGTGIIVDNDETTVTVVPTDPSTPGVPTIPGVNTTGNSVVNNNVRVPEGNDAIFKTDIKNPSSKDETVTVKLNNGTADINNDLVLNNVKFYGKDGSELVTVNKGNGEFEVKLPAGQTEFYTKVPTFNDLIVEGEENFTITSTLVDGKTATGTGIIVDNDETTVTVVPTDPSTPGVPTIPGVNTTGNSVVNNNVRVPEGNDAIFKTDIKNPSSKDETVTVKLNNGTADINNDLVLNNVKFYGKDGSELVTVNKGNGEFEVKLPAGQTEFYTKVPTFNDLIVEGEENFTITSTLVDGKTATGTGIIVDKNLAPIVNDITVNVSEEGLKGGIKDNNGISDTTNETVATGKMIITDPNSDALNIVLVAPTDSLMAVDSNGNYANIIWSGTNTKELIGKVDNKEIIRVTIDNNGNYKVELLEPVKHPINSVEDIVSLNIGVKASDSELATVGKITVNIEDDMPIQCTISNEVEINIEKDLIIVKNLKAGFENAFFLNNTNTVNYVNNDNDAYNDRVDWGKSATGELDRKSGYDLVDNKEYTTTSGSEVNPNGVFKLAQFTHENWALSSGESILKQATLVMNMDVVINGKVVNVSFDIVLGHNETPNDGADPRDIITLPSQNVFIKVDGENYVFTIEGFKDINGNYVKKIYTEEQADNVFDIYGSLKPVDSLLPKVIGNVCTEAGADGLDKVEWGDLNNPYGTMIVGANGGYVFTVNQATKDNLVVGKTLSQNFTYTITDKDGDTVTNSVTIKINGTSVPNEIPTTTDVTVITDEDISKTLSLLDFGTYNDADADSLSSIKIDTLPTNGVLTLSGVVIAIGTVISATDINAGKLIFTPNTNTDLDSTFTFQVSDGKEWSITHTTSIEITAVADVPTASINVTKIISSSNTDELIVKVGTTTYNISDILNNKGTYTEVKNVGNSTTSNAKNIIVNENLDSNDFLKTSSSDNIIVINGDISGGAKVEPMDGSDFVAILGNLINGTINDSSGIDTLYLGKSSSFYSWTVNTHSGDTGMDGTITQYADIAHTIIIGTLGINNIEGIIFADGKTIGSVETINNSSNTVEYKVDINAALTDIDGSETLTVKIEKVPTGATFNSNILSPTSTEGVWELTIPSGDKSIVNTLTMTVPKGTLNFELGITAKATELSNNDSEIYTVSDKIAYGMDETNNLVIDTSVKTNIVVTLDVLGSMTSNSEGVNRLAIAKDAIKNIIDKYGEYGTVNVKVITFSDTGTASQWMTATAAKNYVNSLSAGGYTNYEDAVAKTYNNYSEPTADQTIAYFISDGEPTKENESGKDVKNNIGTDAESGWLDTTYRTGWKDFVDTHVDKLYVIGVGTGITDISYLNVLASAKNTNTIIVTNTNDLNNTLINTVVVEKTIFGEVKDNIFDGDGVIKIDSIEIAGHSYKASDYTTTNIAIINDLQGKLEFNFSTGKYSYTTDSGKISDDMIKIFKVNASDIDGDTTSFDVKIKVDITPNETVTTIKIPDNDTIDLTSLISNNYKNVTDVIDMTDGKINTLKIEMKDIVDLVDADKELIIKGDLGDKVDLDKPSDWSNSGKEQVDGINYNVYKGIGTNSTIKLLIDDDIDVTL